MSKKINYLTKEEFEAEQKKIREMLNTHGELITCTNALIGINNSLDKLYATRNAVSNLSGSAIGTGVICLFKAGLNNKKFAFKNMIASKNAILYTAFGGLFLAAGVVCSVLASKVEEEIEDKQELEYNTITYIRKNMVDDIYCDAVLSNDGKKLYLASRSAALNAITISNMINSKTSSIFDLSAK